MLNLEIEKFPQGALQKARPKLFCGGFLGESGGEAMKKTKSKTRVAGTKRHPARRGGKLRKPVDLEAVRQQISDLVGGQAVELVEITIAEADKGHYGAMKYLFEWSDCIRRRERTRRRGKIHWRRRF